MSAIYSEDVLKKDILSGAFAPVYILFGDDAYLKKYYADRISAKAYGGDPFFNLQKFEGNIDLQNVYDAVNQFPMMAESKCVVLTDYDFEHADKSDFDRLCEILAAEHSGCVLILRFDSVEADIKRSNRLKSLVSSAEKCGGKAFCLGHRRPAELIKMLSNGAEKRGCKLSESTARYLIETVGDDINFLKCELDKLCSYKSGSVIEKDAVDAVCVKSVEASVYDFVKLIFSCDLTKALNFLDDMFFMRIEPIAVLYTVSAAFVDAYRVSAGVKSKTPNSEVAKIFGYKNRAFVLDKAAVNLRKLDDRRILLCFNALIDADRSLKSVGFDPKTVLEQLTVQLVYIIARGEQF